MWFSETADIWDDCEGSFGAAKRALYVAILHRQLPLDFLVEQDALDGTLDRYKVLYLTDRHVSRAASERIVAWVRSGGTLFATAGAGMFDEYDRPNKTLRELLAVDMTALVAPQDARVEFVKQDLPFARAIDTVTWLGHWLPVTGAIAKVKVGQEAAVQGIFSDGSPASHIVCPVVCSEPLVEASLIESKAGAVIVLTNWNGAPIQELEVTLNFPPPGRNVSLASGTKVLSRTDSGKAVFTLDLDVADVLILR